MIMATLILVIAALVIIVVGFVIDRMAIRKIKGGMRTLNKRIKEFENNPYNIQLCSEEVTNIAEMDSEAEKENDYTPVDSDDGKV